MMRYKSTGVYARQNGAALVVGLILLMVLTVLAVSGMGTAALELQMTGNQQFTQNAFQAAETGIDRAMGSGNFTTVAPVVVSTTQVPGSTTESFATRTEFNDDNGVTPVPAGGFSLGGPGFQAYHFDITSTGTSSRAATSTHMQSFYIVGPGGS